MYNIDLLNNKENINTLLHTLNTGSLLTLDHDAMNKLVSHTPINDVLSQLLTFEWGSELSYPAYSGHCVIESVNEECVYQFRLIHINSVCRLAVCYMSNAKDDTKLRARYVGSAEKLSQYMRGIGVVYTAAKLEGESVSVTAHYRDRLIEEYVSVKCTLYKLITEKLFDDNCVYTHGYLNTDSDTYYVRVDGNEYPMTIEPVLKRVAKVIHLRITIHSETPEVMSLYLNDELRTHWQHLNSVISRVQSSHVPGDALAICC